MDEWLESVYKSHRGGTYRGYLSMVRTHINPVIGDVPLTALTRQNVDQVTNAARPKLKPSTSRCSA